MADIDVWGLSAIGSPAAADRIPIATGAGAGGYSLRGSFAYRVTAGYLLCNAASVSPAATGPTAGTVDGTVSAFFNNGFSGVATPYGLSIGVAGNGNSWLQSQRNDGAGTAYAILFQPVGGGVGIGTTSVACKLHVKSANEILRLEATTARGSGNLFLTFHDPTGRKGILGYGSGVNDSMFLINDLNLPLYFGINGSSQWQINGGNFLPATDNAHSFGSAIFRPTQLFAVTGTIGTSDEREKTWRGAPTTAELAAARRIIAELGFYQWNDAVAEKGDAARMHFGPRAQQVWAIMADEGLIDPLTEGVTPDSKYAFLCWDEWDAIAPVEAVDEERDEDGNVIAHAQSAQPGRDAGDRFGVRTDQLALFLIAAQEARLAALEAAL